MAAAQGTQRPGDSLPTLTTAHAAHSLSHTDAARAYPVHLRAVVTYFDPYADERMGDLFVHDATGCIFVKLPSQPVLKLQAGDIVEVSGVSGPGDFAPIVDRPQVRVIGKSQIPAKAPKIAFGDLASGGWDGQWVEFEGLVQSTHLTANNAILNIATPGGSLTATTRRDTGVDYDALVDAEIRLHGNVAPLFNWKMQMVGAHLFFPSLGQIQVVQPPPPDPFKQPVLPLADLLRFEPGKQLDHRVHVQGTVTLQWPGLMLCIEQGSQTLCMKSLQPRSVKPGDIVNVIGFPAVEAYRPTLEGAAFHLAAPGTAPPTAAPVSADDALSGKHEGQLVTLEGEMAGQRSASSGLELLLRSGGVLVPALLPRDLAGEGRSIWKEGSILRVSGICLGQAGPDVWALGGGQVRPGTFQILLRSVDDVQLLQAPSWWTPGHTEWVVAAVGTLTLGAFAWIFVLRRAVKQRTRELRHSEARLRHLSEHDALTDLPNRIVFNDQLQSALTRAERTGNHFGMLMLDLDGFKAVNDELGHQAGDKLLCEVAGRMCQSVRTTDTVARLGGDEFVILLPDLRQPEEAESIAEKIVTAIASPFEIDRTLATVTASVGVLTSFQGGSDPETMLRCADQAMYAAKKRGKNRFEVYRPAPTVLGDTNRLSLRLA